MESGVEEGAEIYQPECVLPERGFWFRPTLFTGVSQSHRIAREEIFGPVLSILTFRTADEAVEKANNTPYGLSAPASGPRRARASCGWPQRLRAGVVWANTFNRFDPTSPFGGYKESGFGREGGLHGLEPYLAVRRWRRRERPMSPRVEVRRTAKLLHRRRVPSQRERPLVRGHRPRRRGRSPRSSQASRKDLREAVVAARGAFPGWSGATAYNCAGRSSIGSPR